MCAPESSKVSQVWWVWPVGSMFQIGDCAFNTIFTLTGPFPSFFWLHWWWSFKKSLLCGSPFPNPWLRTHSLHLSQALQEKMQRWCRHNFGKPVHSRNLCLVNAWMLFFYSSSHFLSLVLHLQKRNSDLWLRAFTKQPGTLSFPLLCSLKPHPCTCMMQDIGDISQYIYVQQCWVKNEPHDKNLSKQHRAPPLSTCCSLFSSF